MIKIKNINYNLNDLETTALQEVLEEYLEATGRFGPFNSAHEGWAVIKEELDELWEEVRKKESTRTPDKLKNEAKQVAAMSLRFMVDVCLKSKGFQ